MKRGHQGRALPAQGHVATAEIAHDAYAGTRHNLIVIAYLHRMGRAAGRLMPDRLAVAANRHYIFRVKFLLLHQRVDRISKQAAELVIKPAELGERQRLSLADIEDRRFNGLRHRPAQARLLRHHMFINGGQHHVHPVEAGAGHHSNVAT